LTYPLARAFIWEQREPDVISCKNLRIREFGLDAYSAEALFLPGHFLENHVVLIGEQFLQALQMEKFCATIAVAPTQG
jgi:hypothetical protein